MPELKCCRISDYPDFDRRGYFLGIRPLPAADMALVKRTIDAPVELYVDNIGDTQENCSELPEWTVGNEAEPIG